MRAPLCRIENARVLFICFKHSNIQSDPLLKPHLYNQLLN
ncbi:hypothetical protein EMIT0P2_20082 [Pseudomonas sp. IT-P2]